MSLLLPYLTVPVCLAANPDIAGSEDKEKTAKILPQHVQFYHEGHSWGIIIYLQCGHAIMSRWTMEQYEQAVRDYWQEIENQGKKQSSIIGLNPKRN